VFLLQKNTGKKGRHCRLPNGGNENQESRGKNDLKENGPRGRTNQSLEKKVEKSMTLIALPAGGAREWDFAGCRDASPGVNTREKRKREKTQKEDLISFDWIARGKKTSWKKAKSTID